MLAPVVALLRSEQIAEAAVQVLVFLRPDMPASAITAWTVIDAKAASVYDADRILALRPLVIAAAERVAALAHA